jgi:hypothetical protein
MAIDGTDDVHDLAEDVENGLSLYPIVPDPATPGTKAWFMCPADGYLRSYTPGATPTPFGPKTLIPAGSYSAWAMATGADDRLYVARYDSAIDIYSLATDPPTLVDTWTVPAGCAGTNFIFRGPGTKLYFSAAVDRAVCSVTTDGDFAVEGSVVGSPSGMIAFGPDGNLWTTTMAADPIYTWGGWVNRVGVGGAPYVVEMPYGSQSYPRGLALGSGRLWVTTNVGLYAVQVTP